MTDPRRARLEADAAGLRRLASQSGGTIAIEAAEGTPPTRWVLRLRCTGATALANGDPRLATEHRVEVRLGATYPLQAPEVRFLTPLVHPHVWSDGRLCVGRRAGMTERLEDLVLRIGGIIQWDPALLDPTSAANRTALLFAQSKPEMLPFGRETFRRPPKPAAPPVTWKERS